MTDGAIRTTCPYCGVGCGVLASVGSDTSGATTLSVAGDPAHPANRGSLCSKGSALGETLGLQGRLLEPQIGGNTVGWDAALDHVAQGFARIIREHGPDSVAFYVSGQLLTEDYYVANKLMKGYIGSANIDTNSRLCMSSAVAAHKRAFGEDLVPICYEDLELADLIVLVGSNTAWCHPVLYQRMLRAREQRGTKIVVIDPRRTPTCDQADLHLPLRAGTDVWLFNGLLSYLLQHGHADRGFIEQHTQGLARARVVAENTAGDVAAVARRCGVDAELLCEFYELFATTERTITAFSQGVNQSSSGTDKGNSLINCHLVTGRIGKPGMGPFSITGQPNAMGGREVGGLANMLAAHMDLENAGHRELVQGFWNSPVIAQKQGLKAVDLFDAVHAGRVKAVWIMATNPLVSMPNANKVREALRRCELVVVSDCIADTDTNRMAQVLLPAAGWGEKDGTVTNSDRVVSRQRPFLPLQGSARPDWWIVSQVARRMGFECGFAYQGPAQIFAEHAALSAVGNDGDRAFNLGALADIDAADYEALEPAPWPRALGTPQGTARLFGDGRFQFADGRARFVAVRPRAPQQGLDEEYPLVLNTGRIRDQWHTMTRTGRSPRLGMHLPEPFVDLHPGDALSFGVRAGDLVRVRTRWGQMVARLQCSGEVRRGTLFVPIHWSSVNSSDARIGALVNPVVDPVSGEPEFKHTPARVEPFHAAWYGFALSRHTLQPTLATWWASAQGREFQRYEMAGRQVPGDWSAAARKLLGVAADADDWIEYSDRHGGLFRGVWIRDGRIEACMFVAPRPELPSRAWLSDLFLKSRLDPLDRAGLLNAKPTDPSADAGATICSCFGVGRNRILQAIADGCVDPKQIGAKLKAGTNCGSCIPELRKLIAEVQAR
ncbi:MAG: molybdopterin-dependent oxidoreductase [Steroidobacteraceae bacterium]